MHYSEYNSKKLAWIEIGEVIPRGSIFMNQMINDDRFLYEVPVDSEEEE